MFDFHSDKKRYFGIQKSVTEEDVIPFLESYGIKCTEVRVLEIGCAEAGVLKAFIDRGNIGVGVELSPSRFKDACRFLADDIADGKARIVNRNIYDIEDPAKEFGELFDLIILKDVIEHIPDQKKFITRLSDFMAQGGVVFFAYPPWWMPFGGHQQICKSKVLRSLPWFHLLPGGLYKTLLRLFGESQATITELMEVKSTGINTGKMLSAIRTTGYRILGQKYWLINPIYRYKFGIKKRELSPVLSSLPGIKNLFTTAHYIIFARK